jgi:hypothetical protein
MDTLQRPRLRALRYTMQRRTLRTACGWRRILPALLTLHAVCGGVGAISAAADIGRGMERHGRPMRRGQLGMHGGLQAEPDRGAVLLPAGHPELVAGWREICWPMWGGVQRWFLVGQQHCIVFHLHGAAEHCKLDNFHELSGSNFHELSGFLKLGALLPWYVFVPSVKPFTARTAQPHL